MAKKATFKAEWDEELEKKIEKKADQWSKSCGGSCKGGAGGGAVYGLGFVGALIYFIQTATSFWDGVWGVIQAIFWPAIIAYELLRFFKF